MQITQSSKETQILVLVAKKAVIKLNLTKIEKKRTEKKNFASFFMQIIFRQFFFYNVKV